MGNINEVAKLYKVRNYLIIKLQTVPQDENRDKGSVWCPFVGGDIEQVCACLYEDCPAWIHVDTVIEIPEKKSRVKLAEVGEPEKIKPQIELTSAAVKRGYCFRIYPYMLEHSPST